MIRITEEQKLILNIYEGGKSRAMREMEKSLSELKSTGEDFLMQKLLEELITILQTCTNKEFFLLRQERLLDSEEEEMNGGNT